MRFKASLLYAIRIIKPKEQTSSNGRKSLLGAVFGVALSLVPLVLVLVVADGMIEGITGRIVGLSTYDLQVLESSTLASRYQENVGDLQNLADEIAQIDGVTATFIERQGISLAAGQTGRTGATVRAVPENLFTESSAFRNYVEVIEGVAGFPTDKSVVIGKKIASTLDLFVGDTIRLITTRVLPNGRVGPKILSCTVSGIISSGYEELDALWVFLPLKTGFEYLSSASSQVRIGIETENAFSNELTTVYRNIASILPVGYRIFRWSDVNVSQYENYASTKMLLMLIMFLILLVASVNISSALIMVVMERQREIAILKSMGASSSGISIAFLITGILCGAGGLLFGLPLGLILGLNFNEILNFFEILVNEIVKVWYYISNGSGYSPIVLLDPTYYLETIPVTVPIFELFLISAGTFLLSVLVSVAPAARAGKEKPLDILRKM